MQGELARADARGEHDGLGVSARDLMMCLMISDQVTVVVDLVGTRGIQVLGPVDGDDVVEQVAGRFAFRIVERPAKAVARAAVVSAEVGGGVVGGGDDGQRPEANAISYSRTELLNRKDNIT